MKYLFPILLLTSFLLNSCDFSKKTEELDLRESKLLEKEKAFALKEADYQSLIKMRDSLYTIKDSVETIALPQNVIGKWNGKIICTDSNCPENMIGDVRNDTWEFIQDGQNISAKVINRTGQIRVYQGTYNGSEIRLNYKSDSSAAKKTEINVLLKDIQDSKIKGTREVTGENNCISRFSVDLDKSKN